MVIGGKRRTSDASLLMHLGYAADVTPQPSAPEEEPRQRFARVVREARQQRGWSQDDLADAAEVSRPTVQRYEYAKTATPDPEAARRIFRALGLDPRLIPVVLGFVTAEEMALPPEPPRVFEPSLEEVIAIWEDPDVPVATKREWAEYLKYRKQMAAAQLPAYDANGGLQAS